MDDRRCRACAETIADDAIYCDICGVRQESDHPKKHPRRPRPWSVPGGLTTLALLTAVGLAIVKSGFQFLASISPNLLNSWLLGGTTIVGALIADPNLFRLLPRSQLGGTSSAIHKGRIRNGPYERQPWTELEAEPPGNGNRVRT